MKKLDATVAVLATDEPDVSGTVTPFDAVKSDNSARESPWT